MSTIPAFQLFGNGLALANQTVDHRLGRGDQLAAEVAVDRRQLAVEGIECHFLPRFWPFLSISRRIGVGGMKR